MKYLPGTVLAVDYDIAKSPYFGGEFAVFLTQTPAALIAEISLSAAATGTYVDNLATAIAAATDLQMVAVTPIRSAVALAVILSGLDNSGPPTVAMDGTATFTPPTRAANQTFNFARGIATDLVPATAGKLFTAINGLKAGGGAITGGGANQVLRLYQLPELADYSLIEPTTKIDFNTKSRMAKGIDSGMEADMYVKRGKSQPGTLTIGSKFKSFVEGMTRFDGQKCTAMLVGIKDGQLTGDRLVFTEYTPNIKVDLPEGDGEATIDVAEGKFVDHLFFVAPGP